MINLTILDTASIYRRLLDASDATQREAIYRDELLAPFAGLFRIFSAGDPMATVRMWGLYTPDDIDAGAGPALTSVLGRLAAHDAWEKTAGALERARLAFAPFGERIPLQQVTAALVVANKEQAPPGDRGYTGFGGIPGYVLVSYSDPNSYNLPRLGAAAAHEFNHNVRFSVYPFRPMTVTVGEYMVAEGLAEAFAVDLFGEDVVGYYVTDISEDNLATARRLIGDALDVSGFDAVRGYIFGDTISVHMGRAPAGVPDYAGYAVGYHTVRRYLQRSTKTAAEATLVPAAEIIAASGYFA